MIPFVGPAEGIIGSSTAAGMFPLQIEVLTSNSSKLLVAMAAKIKAFGHVVATSAVAVSKSKALSATVGAGLGAAVALTSTRSADLVGYVVTTSAIAVSKNKASTRSATVGAGWGTVVVASTRSADASGLFLAC